MDSDFRPPRAAKSLRKALEARHAETETDSQADFRTPDEVAAIDSVEPTMPRLDLSIHETPAKPRRSWRQKLDLHWPPGRKEYGVIAGLVLVLGLAGYLAFGRQTTKPVARVEVAKLPKKVAPTTVPSVLSGLQVDPAVNNRPVIGVMIENSLDARPQAGLSDAGVVFEAIAEGGITRFLALYQDKTPADLGPVRSARPYYLDWAMGFDAAYAHVGGSPEALNDIKAWGVRDLDQFFNAGSYHRVSSRAAPHNVYTSADTLTQLAVSKGYASSNFSGFPRKELAKKPAPATVKSIDLRLSGSLYNVHYDYAAATNSYNRSEGGSPHMDANGNKQLSPTVVIAMVVPYGIQSDGHHSEYATIGSGPVTIFQDGGAITGTWSKTDRKTQLTFVDANGKPIQLNPGQTWITAVSEASKISSSP